jgi:hypothetical protein
VTDYQVAFSFVSRSPKTLDSISFVYVKFHGRDGNAVVARGLDFLITKFLRLRRIPSDHSDVRTGEICASSPDFGGEEGGRGRAAFDS